MDQDALDDRGDDWLDDWLEDPAEGGEIRPSSAVDRFRRNTLAGAVLNGMALGLRDVFDPVEQEEAPIVREAPGEPDEPRRVDAHLDPDDPSGSLVFVRPWLWPDAD